MRKLSLGVSTILALVLAILQPVGPAMSVDTVTKTFNVTKSDGSAYAGVSVALLGWDDETQRNVLSTVETTNAQGQATVVVPATADLYYGYGAQPPVNDFSHAVFVEYSVSSGIDESFDIKMRAANLVVELKQTNNQTALPGSWVHFPATGDIGESISARPVIRSGPIPIDVSTGLNSAETYVVKAEPNGAANQFWAEYSLKVDNSNAINLFSDSSATQPITPRVVGSTQVFDLSFSSANLRGKLTNSSNQVQTLPAGVTARVTFYKADSSGAIDPDSPASAEGPVLATGLYDAKISKPVAGKYFPVFAIAGSLTISSFTGEAFYIDANGHYSNSNSGPFVGPESFELNSKLPANSSINVKVQVTVPGTQTPEKSYVSVLKELEDGSSIWLGAGRTNNGLASFSLADGVYRLFLDLISTERTGKQYDLVVDQGEATLTLRPGTAVSADTNGVFQLSGGLPNLKIRITNPDDQQQTLRQVSVNVINPAVEGDNFVSGTWAQNGFAYLSLANGTFEVRLDPQAGGFALRAYSVTVTSNSVSITDPLTQSAIQPGVDGVFSLAAHKPNITGRLIDSDGATVGSKNNAWVNVELQKWNDQNNNWDYVKNGYAPVMSDGTFGLRAEAVGTFRLKIRSQGRLDISNTTTSQFTVTDLNQVIARGNITLDRPVLKLRVSQSGRSSYLNSAEIRISNQNGFDDYANTGNLGAAALTFPSAGTYDLTVSPPYGLSSAVAASKKYQVTVTGSAGSLSAAIAGVNIVNGFADLALGLPNVTGKIVRPDGAAIVRTNGVWINIQAMRFVNNENRWEWTDNWTQIASDGSFGFALEQIGTYQLRIEPSGIDGAAITKSVQFDVTEANRAGVAKAFGDIRLSAPSAKFKVRVAGSTTDLKYSGIEVRKDGEWLDWLNTNQAGVANFAATGAGSYEFITHPNGDSSVGGVRKTYNATVTETPAGSGQFVVAVTGAPTDSSGFTVLNLGVPNVSGKLIDQNGAVVTQSNRSWVNIQVQKYESSGDYWNWTNNVTNVRNDGTFGLSVVEPGTYRLLINAGGRQDIARTVTSQFVITSSNASTFTKAFGNIVMNGPSLSGTVSSPDGSTKLANSQVLAIDSLTGQEMWEYSSQTDNDGRWSMLLPKGSYSIFARAPWGNQDFGSGEAITGITIDSSGVATLSSGSANAIQLRVSNPTWSGLVVAPGTNTPLPYTSVCLFQMVANIPTNQCTESNSEGKWALSKPLGFAGFDETAQLSIRENRTTDFAEARYTGKTEVEAKLGVYVQGQTYSKQLSPLAPNTLLTIMAGSDPAANVWVSIERDSVGWVTSGRTNAQGVVRLNIPSIATGFKIRPQVESNRSLSETYATTMTTVSSSDVTAGTANGVFSKTLALALPNFSATILTPGSSPAPVLNSWVDAYNLTTNSWSGGSNSLANGNVALNLTLPSVGDTYRYRVYVNAPWGNPDLLASSQYYVTVSSSGTMEIRSDSETGPILNAPAQNERWALKLKAPSVTGTVVLPDNSLVRDSYINALKLISGWEQWVEGGNSRNNGAFGLALADGNYDLFANVPWNLSGYAKSSRCSITITSGAISSNDSSCVTAGQVKLSLRAPNLKFKMVHSGQAVANSHVFIQIGAWNTWAQAGRDGVVSMFIDEAEVLSKNPNQANGSVIPVRITVDPPYGNSEIVRWDCFAGDNKPLCNQLQPFTVGSSYFSSSTAGLLNDVQFMTPNTRLTVKLPNGTENAGIGAWAVLFVEETGWKRWLAGSNSAANGEAVFNVDDLLLNNPATRFTVEVNAPYQQRSTYSQKTYSGLTWAQVNNATFALATPNLKLTVKQAQSTDANAFGWVGVEELDSSFNSIGWLGGYGLDQTGQVSLNLPSSKKVRLSLNPGPGATGARSSCVFDVNSSGQVIKTSTSARCIGNTAASVDVNGSITLELGAGNFIGTVTKADTQAAASGAIVYAQAYSSGVLVEGKTEQAITKADGRYGLQLDSAFDWKIKVFFVNPEGAATNYNSILTEWTVQSASLMSPQTKDFELAVRN